MRLALIVLLISIAAVASTIAAGAGVAGGGSTKRTPSKPQSSSSSSLGDLVAKLEEELQVMTRQWHEKTSSSTSLHEHNKRIRGIVELQHRVDEGFKGLLQNVTLSARSDKGILTINTKDHATLQKVFFGGEPFLIQCGDITTEMNGVVVDAVADLAAKGITVAVIDCNDRLPSGKTVVDRFFKSHVKSGKLPEPFFFVVANRQTPRSFSFKSVVTKKKLVDFVDIATVPVVKNVTSTTELKSACLQHKWCLLAVTSNETIVGGEGMGLVSWISKQYRSVPVVVLNSTLYKLSFEESLPKGVSGDVRFVFIQQQETAGGGSGGGGGGDSKASKTKKKKSVGAKAFRAEMSKDSLSEFVDSCTKGTTQLSSLKADPTVTQRRSSSPPPTSKPSDYSDKKKSKKETINANTSGGGKEYELHTDKTGKKATAREKSSSQQQKKATKNHNNNKNNKNNNKMSEGERSAKRRQQMEAEAKEHENVEFVQGSGSIDFDDADEEVLDIDEDEF